MSQYIDGPRRQFTAGAAIIQHLRVKFTSSKLAVAGSGDPDVGTMAIETFADLDLATVILNNASGSVKMVADESISAFTAVFGAAGGKITDLDNGNFIGYAMEAASGNNSVIEVLRVLGPPPRNMYTVNTETLDATKTLVAGDAYVQVLDPGGSARQVNLPAEADSNGLGFWIVNAADATEVITVKDDSGTTIVTPTQSENAILISDGTTWHGTVGASV